MFELYFQINDEKPKYEGCFQSKELAWKTMQNLIKKHSTLKHAGIYFRTWQTEDGFEKVDYGAYNAFYLIKKVDKRATK